MAKRVLDLGKVDTPFGKLPLKYDVVRHWFRLGKEWGQELEVFGVTTKVAISIVIYSDSPQIKVNVELADFPLMTEKVRKALVPVAKRIVEEHGKAARRASWERERDRYSRYRESTQRDLEFYDTMLAKIEGEIKNLAED